MHKPQPKYGWHGQPEEVLVPIDHADLLFWSGSDLDEEFETWRNNSKPIMAGCDHPSLPTQVIVEETVFTNPDYKPPTGYEIYGEGYRGDNGSAFIKWYDTNRNRLTRPHRDPATIPSDEIVARHRAYADKWPRDPANHRDITPGPPKTVSRVNADGECIPVGRPPRPELVPSVHLGLVV